MSEKFIEKEAEEEREEEREGGEGERSHDEREEENHDNEKQPKSQENESEKPPPKDDPKGKRKDEEEEEEEEGPDQYVKDGFVVDDEEAEESASDNEKDENKSGEEVEKKKKKRKRGDPKLDVDDLILLRDAGVITNQEPTPRYKRLKKKGSENADTEEKEIQNLEDEGLAPEENSFDEEEDEFYDMDSFEVDSHGRPLGQKHFAQSSQMAEAAKIFGDEDLMEEEYEEPKRVPTLEETYEPDDLAKLYLNKEDQEIQKRDIPERLQLREKKIPVYTKRFHYFPSNQGSLLMFSLEQRDGTKADVTLTVSTLSEAKEYLNIGENAFVVYVDSLKAFYPIQTNEDLIFLKENAQTKLIDPEEVEGLMKTINEKKQDKELRDEAEWIFHNAFEANSDTLTFQNTVTKIIYILKFLKRDSFEIPYIYLYKKDYYAPDLNLSDLWEIYDWDEKWEHIQYRRSVLYEKFVAAQVPSEYYTLLEESQKEVEVQDLFDHFSAHYGESIEPIKNKKRAHKRDLYSVCKRNGILEFARKFGLSATELGENMAQGKMVNSPKNYEIEPDYMAENYTVTTEFKTTETVLKAARSAMAQEIALDPRVRSSIRLIYEKNVAEISTYPTEKGRKEVDAFHPYRIVLRIDRKPPQAFQQSQFLLILKAQKEGFIEMKVGISEQPHEENFKEMENLYLDPNLEENSVVTAWNIQRREILREAFEKYLYPQFERELIQSLTEQATERVTGAASKQFTERLMLGPYQPPSEIFHQNPTEVVIMAGISGIGREPHFFVVLDPDGIPKANLKIGSSERDKELLTTFIKEQSPHVVAIGATLEGRRLYKVVCDIKKDMGLQDLHVTFVETETARIFQDSPRAKSEFPDSPWPLRLVIGLARYLQDPLTELAAACSTGEAICLKLNNLQDMINKEHLHNSLQRCVINVVNSVGVDINRCVQFKHAANLLEFVSGLGPRKASDLIRRIVRSGSTITSRDKLEQSYLDPCVYTNAAGFIRIPRKYAVQEWTPLDDTRIHPDDYLLVEKMAKDALETNKKKIVRLMQEPKKLDDVDLDEFAEELRRKGKPKKRSILYDIKAEINRPFQDRREDYRDPPPEKLFYYFTGEEEDESIKVGQLINATVISVDDRAVRCRLDSGLPAIVNKDDVSDENVSDLTTLGLAPGTVIACRIKEIKKDRLEAILVCKTKELQSTYYDRSQLDHLKKLEPHLIIDDAQIADPSTRAPKKRNAPKKPIGRQIQHPLFQNLSFREAEQYLESQPNGELLIRPSSKGTDHITITWKFREDIYVHINIREEGKSNPKSLGKILYVENHKFEDLDEIVSRYIEPMNQFVEEMVNFRRFQNLTKQEVEDSLQSEKRRNPSQIPYFLSFSSQHPGKFLLSYLPNQTVKHEYVSVSPQGFRFRSRTFPDPEKLVAWFKNHWKEVPRPSHSNAPPSSSSRRDHRDHHHHPPPPSSHHHSSLPPNSYSRSNSNPISNSNSTTEQSNSFSWSTDGSGWN